MSGSAAPGGFVVAIDGPAASGKSTTARLAAERLGFLYLDTGAMYRAVTWKALESGVDPGDAVALAELVGRIHVQIVPGGNGARVHVDGEDVTEGIREPRISRAVSRVSSVPAVRRAMVEIQRRIGRSGAVVVEGRDIGTVVFPDARVKIFLEASLEERAARRQAELRRSGVEQSREELAREIRSRDELDSGRADSPLRRAPDAVHVDTTRLSIDQQVDEVVRVVREALAAGAGEAPG
jgi:cytidylate kinase